MNFLSRLFSQPTTQSCRPFENQLTETLVGICENVPLFKRGLFKLLLQDSFEIDSLDTEQMNVNSQVYHEGKSIDIELSVSSGKRDRLLTVFVEVKVWSGENYSQDLENKDEEVGQMESYCRILDTDSYSSFGKNVGLLTLTPFSNQLEIIRKDDKPKLMDFQRTNFFWHEIGKLLEKTIDSANDEKEQFLLSTFLEYLKEVGIMSDQTLSIQELATIDSYVSVKKKMWATLEETAKYMKKELPKGGNKSSWTTASTQEQWQDRFVAYQYLKWEKSELCIFAGYYFNEGSPWIGVWLEGRPGDELVQRVRAEVAAELVLEPQVYDDEFEDNDSWTVFAEDKDEWWFLIRTKNLIEFVDSEQGVSEISEYFLKNVKEVLSLNCIKGLMKRLEK